MDIKTLYNESATKSRTRQNILIAAENTFSKYGIESSTMVKIAAAANITIRNLYRYYPDINSLVVDTAHYAFKQIDNSDQFRSIGYDENETGYSVVEKIITKFVKHYRENENNLSRTKFMLYFDIFLSNMNISDSSNSVFRTDLLANMEIGAKGLIEEMLIKGMEDGTIKMIEDPDFYSRFIINSLLGLITRVELNEYGNPEFADKLMNEQLQLILGGIKK